MEYSDLAHQNFERILLINFGGIGDEILFFPVIKALRQHYEEAHISVLVEPRCQSIMEHNYLLDQVHTFDIKHRKHPSDLLELLNTLKMAAPDMIISSGSSPFVALLLFLSGIPYRVGYASNRFKFLLTHSTPLDQDQYAAKMYYDLLLGLGFPESHPVPEMHLPPPILAQTDQWLAEHQLQDSPYILIHPGVSKMSKEKQLIKSWAMDKWVTLIERLLSDGHQVVLAGGPDDDDELSYLQAHLEHPELYSIYGQTRSMFELGAFIQRSGLMLCLDSAPMHLGVALQANVLTIFGPTDETKLLPLERDNIATVHFDIACRPCLWATRQTTCAELSCLKEIEVEKVYQAIQKHAGFQAVQEI